MYSGEENGTRGFNEVIAGEASCTERTPQRQYNIGQPSAVKLPEERIIPLQTSSQTEALLLVHLIARRLHLGYWPRRRRATCRSHHPGSRHLGGATYTR